MILLPFAVLPFAQVPQHHKAPVFIGQSLVLVKQMEAAFGKLNDARITISSDAGITTVDLLGKKIREVQPAVEWVFDGAQLYLRDTVKHVYISGKCLRHRAVEVVSEVTHQRVDPFTRSLLFHKVPFEEAFLDAKVALLGTVAPQGVQCDILEAEGPEGKMSIFLRRSDHLPLSVSTAVYVDGKAVSMTDRGYAFQKLASPQFVLAPLPTDKLGRFPRLVKETISG